MKKQNEQLLEFISPDFEFGDDRGRLTQLFRTGWNQVNYITSVAGSYRGNHYHKKNKELFFVISGEFKLKLQDMNSDASENHNIKPGMMFIIHPNIMHSFTFTTDVDLISAYNIGVEEADGMDIYTT